MFQDNFRTYADFVYTGYNLLVVVVVGAWNYNLLK